MCAGSKRVRLRTVDDDDDEPMSATCLLILILMTRLSTKFVATRFCFMVTKQKRSNDTQHRSHTVESCPFMCDFMQQNVSLIEGQRVLELGAGLGLCGITAELLGAGEVCMTDGDTDTLAQLRENVKANGCTKITCPQLRWGHRVAEFVEHHGKFDIIIAADIIYVENILEPLFDTAVALMGHTFLLSYARRNVKIDLVMECADRHHLSWTTQW
ncbi:lysine methyltransferase [Fragilaria crotonensis]|nr:lysine methyltransferase [Fragilaria crotonensis]